MRTLLGLLAVAMLVSLVAVRPAKALDLDSATEGFADSGGVKIHYVSLGEGPLIVMIHGFPDYWYTWRKQMPALADHFQVVAIDTRGYNKSDQPKGVENYTMDKLVGDVAAVIKHLGRDKAVICGHDWGGIIAWTFAMQLPEMTDRLVICNLPHPKGLARELANNPDQQKNSQYARNFQKEGSHKQLNAQFLAQIAGDAESREKYREAFERSDFEAMMNYYKANYPKEPYTDEVDYPKVQCRVLMFHGLNDTALLPGALNDTWKWLDKDLTLVTVPGASHWVQRDAADLVTTTMVKWLTD